VYLQNVFSVCLRDSLKSGHLDHNQVPISFLEVTHSTWSAKCLRRTIRMAIYVKKMKQLVTSLPNVA
jgi:hypothetical protein